MPKKLFIVKLLWVENRGFTISLKLKAVNNFKIVMALSVFDVLLYFAEHGLIGLHSPDLAFELGVVLVKDISVFFDVFLDNIMGNLDVNQVLNQLHLGF